jgi:hypothetical protein
MTRREQPPLHPFPKIVQGKRWALRDQGKAALDEVCGALNSETQPELRKRLRELVAAWQDSGPNLKKMTRDPSLLDIRVFGFAMRTIWNPTDGGRAELLLLPDYLTLERLLGEERVWQKGPDGKPQPMPEAESLTLFHLLTVIPECDKLAGPCARCGNYYIKKRASQKVYCSRRCGQAATAVARTSERLKGEHKDKMRRARAVIKEWNALKTRPALEWKEWLKKREPDISEKFVTRWANKNELPQPTRERK